MNLKPERSQFTVAVNRRVVDVSILTSWILKIKQFQCVVLELGCVLLCQL